MKTQNLTNYYHAICKELNIQPVPLKFCRVAKGGACIQHDTKGKIFNIQIDMNRCTDVEYALYHEMAHQLMILKNNNYTHNAAFKKTENMLNEKYMYSKLSGMLYN